MKRTTLGVSTDMIKPEVWDEMSQSLGSVAPIMMSNGKVRRRLRWKPKNMMRKSRAGTLSQHITPISQTRGSRKSVSSDASLNSNSNASFASRFSRRSEHSFGSMETQLKNNTTKALYANRLPKYPPGASYSFDGQSTTTIDGGSSAFARQVSELSASTQWQKATVVQDGTKDAQTAKQLDPTDLPPLAKKGSEIRRHYAKPPRPTQLPSEARDEMNESSADTTSVSSSITSQLEGTHDEASRQSATDGVSLSIAKKWGRRKIEAPMQNETQHAGSDAAITATQPSHQIEQHDNLLTLSGEDVEHERRVDLRIRKTGMERRLSFGRNRSRANSNVLTTTELSNLLSTANVKKPEVSTAAQDSAGESQPTSASRLGTLSSVLGDPALPRTPDNKPTLPPAEEKLEDAEIRFTLSEQAHNDAFEKAGPEFDKPVQPRRATSPCMVEIGPGGKPVTVPVDVDDGTFLEAEKNLKAIHEMASEHLRQREYSEALEVFEEILRGQLARYGASHYRIGTALHNIGIVHMRRGDYLKAMDVYKDAVTIRKLTLSPDHPDVAVSLAQLGVAYLETHQHKDAIAVFREALKIRRNFYGSQHPKVAKVLNNIGCALFELNEVTVANVAFKEALEIQRHNLKDFPPGSDDASNLALLSIASTLSNLGSVKLITGSLAEASVVLEEALLIQQCVYGDNHPIPRQTKDSLRWIEQTNKSSPFSPNYFNFFTHLAKAFMLVKSDSEAASTRAQKAASGGTDTAHSLAPLTNSLLEAVEQKLVDGIAIACGEMSLDFGEETELKALYSF